MWHAGLWWAPRHGDVAEPMQLGPYSAGIGPLRSKFHRFGRMRGVCGDQQPVTRPPVLAGWATAAVGMVVGAMVVVATVAAARGAGVEAAARVVGATAVAVTEEAVMVAARVAVASLTKPDMRTRTKGGCVFNGDQFVDTAADSRHLPCRDPRFATFRNCSRWPCTNRN